MIVDDHLTFADAVSARLRAEPDLLVVACATSAAEGEAAVGRVHPDVAVVDIGLPGDDGIGLVSRLHSISRDLRTVVLSDHEDATAACAAIRAGASGFVTKASPTDDLLEAVRSVARNETWISARLLTHVLRLLQESPPVNGEANLIKGLSRREREVLSLMVVGLDRAGIARRLFLSTNTVRTHTQNLMAKLGVHSSIEAVSLALRAGMRPHASTHESGAPLGEQRRPALPE